MPKPSNVTSVKTPGEIAPQAQADDEQALDTQISDTSGVDLPKAEATKIDLTDPAQLAAYIQAQVNAGVAAGLHEHRRVEAAAAGKVPEAELPDQSTVNPHTIEREVLTKQGYVVPHNLGAVPEHLKNLKH